MYRNLLYATAFTATLASAALADSGVTIQLQGFPANRELVLPKVCSGPAWDGDCTWDLSFSATINAADGISAVRAKVNGVEQVMSTTPNALAGCDGDNPTTVANATFSHSFAVTCGTNETSAIRFEADDCDDDSKFATADVTLRCETCNEQTLSRPETYSNGITPLPSSHAGQPATIQFAVLNNSLQPMDVQLFLDGPPDWPMLTPLPPMIPLEPGQAQIFLLDVQVPEFALPGMGAPFTLHAEPADGLGEGTAATALIEIVPDEPDCPADVNFDGIVDVNDLVAVIANWGTGSPAGDANLDGLVDVNDIVAVFSAWGPC